MHNDQHLAGQQSSRIDSVHWMHGLVDHSTLELARPGFFGSLEVELELQDGFVTIVRTRTEQVHKNARRRAA